MAKEEKAKTTQKEEETKLNYIIVDKQKIVLNKKVSKLNLDDVYDVFLKTGSSFNELRRKTFNDQDVASMIDLIYFLSSLSSLYITYEDYIDYVDNLSINDSYKFATDNIDIISNLDLYGNETEEEIEKEELQTIEINGKKVKLKNKTTMFKLKDFKDIYNETSLTYNKLEENAFYKEDRYSTTLLFYFISNLKEEDITLKEFVNYLNKFSLNKLERFFNINLGILLGAKDLMGK